jgi:amidase
MLAAAAALAPTAALAAPHGKKSHDSLADLDATATAHLIRTGQLTPLEAVDAAIARSSAVQPKLNFLVTPDYDRARDRAKALTKNRLHGPFAGVPFLVKDLNDVKGLPTYSGSRLNLKTPPKTSQSTYIDAFERAGLNFIGKSATPEYGFLPTTQPVAFGPTRNPWEPSHSTGGSSGGAAAAVAAHVVPFAHASDGGGSIRIPASSCGLFGLKPSRGRLIKSDPDDPGVDLSVSHCVSRSVRDSAALFAATEASTTFHEPVGFVSAPSRKRLKIGLMLGKIGQNGPDADVAARISETADRLRGLGHQVQDTEFPFDADQFIHDFVGLWSAGALQLRQAAAGFVGKDHVDQVLEPYTLGAAALAEKAGPEAFAASVGRLKAMSAPYAQWLTDYDVILSPVLAKAPIELTWLDPTLPFDEVQERLLKYVLYTPLLNVVGAPAMSVPAGFGANGLPVGAHFFTKVGAERTLFSLAYELERAQPWVSKKPPISA